MTSAVKPWETESQPRVTHWPACHICLILFGRIVAPLVLVVGPAGGHGWSVCDAPPQGRTGISIHKEGRAQQSGACSGAWSSAVTACIRTTARSKFSRGCEQMHAEHADIRCGSNSVGEALDFQLWPR